MTFEILEPLHIVPNDRVVLKVRYRGVPAVLRVFAVPVQRALGPLVEKVASDSGASFQGLPEELALPLEGYRVRAGLDDVMELPAILAAGVDDVKHEALTSPPPGYGYAYITTQWLEGEILRDVRDQMTEANKRATLLGLLRLLCRLHDQRVVYGDLKPHNIVLHRARPSLIDLDTLRRVVDAESPVPTRSLTPKFAAPEQVEGRLTYLASDVYSFAKVASWLLERELAARSASFEAWRSILDSGLTRQLADRPTSAELHAALSRESMRQDLDAHTLLGVSVAKVPPQPAGHATQVTEFVADETALPAPGNASFSKRPLPVDDGAERTRRRGDRRWILLLVLVGLALIGGAVALSLRKSGGPESTGQASVGTLPAGEPGDASTAPDPLSNDGGPPNHEQRPDPEDAQSPEDEDDDFVFSDDPVVEALRVESRCGRLRRRGDRVEASVTCGVTNASNVATNLRVIATLFPGGEPLRYDKNIYVPPKSRFTVRFSFADLDAPSEPIECRCDGEPF